MDPEHAYDQFLSRYKFPLIFGLVGIVLLIGGMVSSGLFKSVGPKISQASSVSFVKVDVSGEVGSPGVYSLRSDARVEDAIKSAGGITEFADTEYVSKTLNLAQKVSDGMKVFIPAQSESGPINSGSVSSDDKIVNINMASLESLDKLPGVGPVTAQSITDKRPYASVGELLSKKAVSRSVYQKIKDLVTVF